MEHAGTQPAPIQRAVAEAAPARERRSRASLRLALRRSGVEPLWRLLRLRAGDRSAAGWLSGCSLRSPARPGARPGAQAFEARAAARVAATLGSLKGPFVKAGQFAANRHDLLPASVTTPLAALRDRVPPLPFPEVRAAVELELGAPLADALRRVRARAARGGLDRPGASRAPARRRSRGGEGPVPVARGLAARRPRVGERRFAPLRAPARRRRSRAALRRVRRGPARGARLRARGARRGRDRGESGARPARGGAARASRATPRAAC